MSSGQNHRVHCLSQEPPFKTQIERLKSKRNNYTDLQLLQTGQAHWSRGSLQKRNDKRRLSDMYSKQGDTTGEVHEHTHLRDQQGRSTLSHQVQAKLSMDIEVRKLEPPSQIITSRISQKMCPL